jgi:uncharacterized membrane protein YdjX (TVP38/TMEM64 family)
MDLPERHAGRRLARRRLIAVGALGAAIVGALAITGSVPTPQEAHDWGEELDGWGPVLYIPLFVLMNFLIPWGILAGAGGLLFGTIAGTPLALAAVTLAALAQMTASRRLAGEHAGSVLPERTRALEHFLERNGVAAVMESRVVPLLPYGAVNYAAGLTRLRHRDMALGTIVGGAPKVFGYVALGGSLTDLGSPEAKAAVGLLLGLALVGALLVRRQVQIERATGAA